MLRGETPCPSNRPVDRDRQPRFRLTLGDLGRFIKAVRSHKREPVPIAALRDDFIVLNAEETASAQPERISPLENGPRTILENTVGDADHLGAGKVFGEHFTYRRAPLHRLPNDLIDGTFSIEGRHLIWVATVECLDPSNDQFAGAHRVQSSLSFYSTLNLVHIGANDIWGAHKPLIRRNFLGVFRFAPKWRWPSPEPDARQQ